MDLKGSDPHNILSTLACVNDKNTEACNAFNPLKQYKLYGENPATNKTFTEEQRENKKRAFKNKCGLNNNKVVTCCSPDDTNLGFMADFVKMDVKNKKIRIENGDYFVCAEDSNNPDCRSPTAYDLCKLSSPEIGFNTLENGEQKVTGAAPDCFKGVCASTHDLSYLNDPEMSKFYDLQDSEILTAIEKNNANQIKDILTDKERISAPLTVGYEGNTMLHHAVLHDADDIITLLLSRKVPLDSRNKDGNTPLHLAALKGNSARLHQMIEMGGDVEIKNNLGDSVLFSAIRSADYPTVHVVLHLASATPVSRNRLGETALHIALISPQKNVEIVRLLVNKGVDLYEKNNNGDTALKTLQFQRRTKDNEEIRTYLMNIIIKKEGDNFVKKVKEYPELANFDILDKNGKPINLNYLEGLEGIEVSLPDQYLPDNLQFTESNDYKYKVLTDEEKMQGNETNPLNDVNYFDRGAPDNAVDMSFNENTVLKTSNDNSYEHSHFSEENRAVLNRLIREARNDPEETNSIMGKIKKTLLGSKKDKENKKDEDKVEKAKVRVKVAKQKRDKKLAKLEAEKQKLEKELQEEKNKNFFEKLVTENKEDEKKEALEKVEQEKLSINQEFNTYVQNISFIVGENIEIGDDIEIGDIVGGDKTTVGKGGVLMGDDASFSDRGGVVDQSIIDQSTTTINEESTTTINKESTTNIDTIIEGDSIEGDSITTNKEVTTIISEPVTDEKNNVEGFTIIPKAQNRFYMFALIVLILFFLIALVGSKKLI